MKNKKIDNKYILILTALAIISATLLINTYINNIQIAKGNEITVIVANQDIKINTTILKEMLVFKQENTDEVNPETCVDINSVVGKAAIVPIYKGEAIHKQRIVNIDSKRTNKDFVMKLDSNDKVLNLIPGTFIDIWKVPTKEGFEKSIIPEKVFSGEYVADVKNEAFLSVDEFMGKKDDASQSNVFVPEYIVLNFDEGKMKEISNINPSTFTLRMTLHKDNNYYENLKKLQENKQSNIDVTQDYISNEETVTTGKTPIEVTSETGKENELSIEMQKEGNKADEGN